MTIFQVVQTPESRSMTLCGITSVLPGEAQTAPGSFIWMDNFQSNGTGLKENHQIPAGGTVVIGQDQDTVGGGFQTADSFGPGEVTEVNLWSRVLSASDIAAQYANCHITKVGLMHWWEQFKDGVSGVTVVEP